MTTPKNPNVRKLIKEWAKTRGGPSLIRLPGTAIHVRPETAEAMIQEALASGRPVGAIVREDIELARRVRAEAAREGAPAALRRFLEPGSD